MQELSRTLADDLDVARCLGIGIHTGPTVVGRMGYASTTYLTAVGDTVHVAARREALTKDYACEPVLSPLPIFVAPSVGRLAERLARVPA